MEKMALIYSTFATREDAVDALKTLMKQNLATCGNIAAAHTAIYPWNGEIKEEQETSMLFKTSQGNKDALINALREIHPYELPCIMDLGANATPEYTIWLGTPRADLINQ